MGHVERLLGFAIVLTCVAFHPARAMTLKEAILMGIAHDPKYLSNFQSREIGREYIATSRASLLPHVSANLNKGANQNEVSSINSLNSFSESRKYKSYSSSIAVSQVLYDASAIAAYRQAQIQTDQSEIAFRAGRNDLVVRTVRAYTDVLLARDNVRAKLAEYQSLQEQANSAKSNYAAGEASATDVAEVIANLEIVKADLVGAKDEEENSLVELTNIVGERSDELFTLSDDSCDDWQRPDLNLLLHAARTKSNEILIAQRNEEIARLEIDKINGRFLPNASLELGTNRSRADSFVTYNERNSGRYISVQVTVPIFDGGGTAASSRQSTAARLKSSLDLQGHIDSVLSGVRQNYRVIATSGVRIRSIKNSIIQNDELITATRASIKAGYRVNLDLINAEKQLAATKSIFYQSKYELVNARVQIEVLTNDFSDESISRFSKCFSVASASPELPAFLALEQNP